MPASLTADDLQFVCEYLHLQADDDPGGHPDYERALHALLAHTATRLFPPVVKVTRPRRPFIAKAYAVVASLENAKSNAAIPFVCEPPFSHSRNLPGWSLHSFEHRDGSIYHIHPVARRKPDDTRSEIMTARCSSPCGTSPLPEARK